MESVEANQGSFVGITNPTISKATYSFVSSQTAQGFSLDDVTFGNVTSVPEPATILLLAIGLTSLGIGCFRRKVIIDNDKISDITTLFLQRHVNPETKQTTKVMVKRGVE